MVPFIITSRSFRDLLVTSKELISTSSGYCLRLDSISLELWSLAKEGPEARSISACPKLRFDSAAAANSHSMGVRPCLFKSLLSFPCFSCSFGSLGSSGSSGSSSSSGSSDPSAFPFLRSPSLMVSVINPEIGLVVVGVLGASRFFGCRRGVRRGLRQEMQMYESGTAI